MKIHALNPFACWAAELNLWRFPSAFKFIEPNDWGGLPRYSADKSKRTRYNHGAFCALFKICNLMSTERQRLNHWHCVYMGRTQEQFELWWASRANSHG